MLLTEITEEKVNIGSVLDKVTQQQFEMLAKRCGPFGPKKMPEYIIDLMQNEKPAGYLKFVQGLEGGCDITLSALKTTPGFRGQNLTDAMMELLFQYATLTNTEFNCVVRQKKPLTAYILQKYGFVAVDNRPRDTVEILGRKKEKVLVAFRDTHKRDEFERSTLCTRSEDQYEIVSPQPGLAIDTVTLLSPYMLIDEETCQERRDFAQKRFVIDFLTA